LRDEGQSGGTTVRDFGKEVILADHSFGNCQFVRRHDLQWTPLFYAGAMGVDALSALLFGWWYDRRDMPSLMVAIALSAGFAPLVFSSQVPLFAVGMALWGIGMGAQESIVRAVAAGMVPLDRRATG
jgi:MFS family permease